jgi:hypothetical protein
MGELLSTAISKFLILASVVVAVGFIWYFWSNDRIGNTFAAMTMFRNESWPSYRFQTGRYGTAVIPTATVIANRWLPESQISGTALINDWGGTWQFTGNTNNVRAAVDNVPDSDCTRMVTRFQQGVGLVSIRVGGNLSSVGSATANPAPLTPDNATTLCSNGTNAIEFVLTSGQ